MPAPHLLVSGECLQWLASRTGFADGKAIYDAPENAQLRKIRARPAAVATGDTVVIPDSKPASFTVGTRQVHRFVVKRPKALLRVEVHDENGDPLAGKPYELTVGDDTIEGETAGDGTIEEPLSLDEKGATLVVYDDPSKDGASWAWSLQLASLAGPDTARGVWQRLANLGYWCGEEPSPTADAPNDEDADDPPMDAFALALRAFQHDEGLDESGKLDDATRSQLVKRHGI
jgi:hypothetical protein